MGFSPGSAAGPLARTCSHALTWIGALLVGSGLGSAQRGQHSPGLASPGKSPRKQAQRLVTFLELPHRRRAAAQGLLRLGGESVPALIRALRDPRPDVVVRCVTLLRRLGHHAAPATGDLELLATNSNPVLAHAGRWGLAGLVEVGVTQFVDVKKDVVGELDHAGKMAREVDLGVAAGASIYDADRLANGNYLVCRLGKGQVVELDRKGREVWKFDGCAKPLDADRLANGNTLIAGGNTKRVLEVDPSGKVVWEWRGTPWPNDADRLGSGNTLVADSPAKTVFEVDPAGKVVWKLETDVGVIDVERLSSGHTLIVKAYGKGVAVVDDEGKQLWEYTEGSPRSAFRDSRGFTVVGGRDLVLLAPDGKLVWKKPGIGQISAVHRY